MLIATVKRVEHLPAILTDISGTMYGTKHHVRYIYFGFGRFRDALLYVTVSVFARQAEMAASLGDISVRLEATIREESDSTRRASADFHL